jgi:uncharacterized membrane protein YraQ (UPF0718 family)
MKERTKLLLIITIFLSAYFIPFGNIRIQQSINEAFLMLQDYARHHIILCLIPAFFIAGGIAVFLSQNAVLKYFGANAKKWISYSIASISGTILAVCSCTVLPLFAGIYKRGAGLGPAVAFLYSGPAINVLAIILTAKVLGMELGIARAFGAIAFSVIIGLLMHFIFIKEENKRIESNESFKIEQDTSSFPLYKSIVFFALMIGILVFMNWGKAESSFGIWNIIYSIKWYISAMLFVILLLVLKSWFTKENIKNWFDSTWGFSKQILPLLLVGVMISGFLLGRPGHESLIPSNWISSLVGGNSLFANFFASFAGALMYFATLTEIPILQGLIGNGMGKGPALALLLAGPALSLPSMLVIRSILGTKKALVYIILVIIMATICGIIYGNIF